MGGRIQNSFIGTSYQINPKITPDMSPLTLHFWDKALDTTNLYTTGGTNQTWAAVTDTQGGLWKNTLAANINNEGYLKVPNLLAQAQYFGSVAFRFKNATISADTRYFLGIGDDITDWAAGNPTGIYFYWDGTNFQGIIGSGAAKTAVNFVTSPTQATYYVCRISRNGSYFDFELFDDNLNLVEKQSVIKTNKPSGAKPLVVYHKTTSATSRVFQIDYMSLQTRS